MDVRRDSRQRFAAVSWCLTAALFAGCDEPVVSGLEADLQPVLGHLTSLQAGGDVPFHLQSTATLIAQVFPQDPGRSYFDGRCTVLSDFVLSFGLDGQATHMGAFTGTVEHCTQFDFSTGQASTSDGVLMLSASDGDELWGTYHGTPSPTGVVEHITFVGGSGRFSSASGGGDGHAQCDQAAGTCVFELDGVIDYDAGN